MREYLGWIVRVAKRPETLAAIILGQIWGYVAVMLTPLDTGNPVVYSIVVFSAIVALYLIFRLVRELSGQ